VPRPKRFRLPPLTFPSAHPLATTTCSLHVQCPTKMSSDFGMLPQIEQVHDSAFRTAASAITSSIIVRPTVKFTNALPFPIKATILEAWANSPQWGNMDGAWLFQSARASGQVDDGREKVVGNQDAYVTPVNPASVTAESWTPSVPKEGSAAHRLLFASSSPLHAQVSSLVALSTGTLAALNIAP
jgi:hypothetical protein